MIDICEALCRRQKKKPAKISITLNDEKSDSYSSRFSFTTVCC